MNTISIQLKNGKYLEIPVEFYPRYAHIVFTKENSLYFAPINQFKKAIKIVFSPTFAVLSVINLSLNAPLLITNSSTAYYLYLSIGFVICYYIIKIHNKFIKTQPCLASKLGYDSFESALKPYDNRMIKTIIKVNNIKMRRATLCFDDLYGILFDVATPKRFYDIYGPSHLKLIKSSP